MSSVGISNMTNFLNEYNLRLNAKKSNYLTFKTHKKIKKNINYTIAVKNQLIMGGQSTQFLGLVINGNFT